IEGTPASTFSITRLDGSDTRIYSSRPVNTEDLAVADGFRARVRTDNRLGGLKSITDENGRSVDGLANPSADSSWYVTATLFAQGDTASQTSSYEIRFSGEQTIAYTWGLVGSVAQYTVPFSVWNATTNQQVCFEIRDLNNSNQWDEGETIFVTRVPYPSPAPSMGSANPATQTREFAYQVSINNFPSDSARTPPQSGSIIRLTSYNALRDGDTFEFDFQQASYNAAAVDLSEVRVVPNPYIVTSRFETTQNVRQVRFMYLPPECTITVYTVSGTLVRTLRHNSTTGSLSWNLLTDWNQALAFGIYVYVVEDPAGNRHIGKLALIK
ncbi:MAG: hypothetical protein OEM41_04665, partial [Ignavibacteria bacterium]|nr:hypothetical protein [Ignavibacteria bacterium]